MQKNNSTQGSSTLKKAMKMVIQMEYQRNKPIDKQEQLTLMFQAGLSEIGTLWMESCQQHQGQSERRQLRGKGAQEDSAQFSSFNKDSEKQEEGNGALSAIYEVECKEVEIILLSDKFTNMKEESYQEKKEPWKMIFEEEGLTNRSAIRQLFDMSLKISMKIDELQNKNLLNKRRLSMPKFFPSQVTKKRRWKKYLMKKEEKEDYQIEPTNLKLALQK